MQRLLALCLSFLGGYIDTAGFLTLQGLFTAHVTGNFVTLGSSLAYGHSGGLVKLLALPAFCLTILVLGVLARTFLKNHTAPLKILLLVQTIFLASGAALAIFYGPFPTDNPLTTGDQLAFTACGLLLVIAMAIQNAGHKVHLTSYPPSTLMTGTTTQIMVDIADIIHARCFSSSVPAEAKQAMLKRLSLFIPALVVFAGGCTAGAYGVAFFGVKCFIIPPLITLLCYFMVEPQRVTL